MENSRTLTIVCKIGDRYAATLIRFAKSRYEIEEVMVYNKVIVPEHCLSSADPEWAFEINSEMLLR